MPSHPNRYDRVFHLLAPFFLITDVLLNLTQWAVVSVVVCLNTKCVFWLLREDQFLRCRLLKTRLQNEIQIFLHRDQISNYRYWRNNVNNTGFWLHDTGLFRPGQTRSPTYYGAIAYNERSSVPVHFAQLRNLCVYADQVWIGGKIVRIRSEKPKNHIPVLHSSRERGRCPGIDQFTQNCSFLCGSSETHSRHEAFQGGCKPLSLRNYYFALECV
jgi:hypothetical protein